VLNGRSGALTGHTTQIEFGGLDKMSTLDVHESTLAILSKQTHRRALILLVGLYVGYQGVHAIA